MRSTTVESDDKNYRNPPQIDNPKNPKSIPGIPSRMVDLGLFFFFDLGYVSYSTCIGSADNEDSTVGGETH